MVASVPILRKTNLKLGAGTPDLSTYYLLTSGLILDFKKSGFALL